MKLKDLDKEMGSSHHILVVGLVLVLLGTFVGQSHAGAGQTTVHGKIPQLFLFMFYTFRSFSEISSTFL